MATPLQIQVQGENLDLLPDEENNFYLTKLVYDISNLETRNADFSKTIGIPLTGHNRVLLGDNVPMLERFSQGAVNSIPCQILMKGVPVLEDALLVIDSQDVKNEIVSATVIAGSARFFNQLSTRPIGALSLAYLNIEWTLAGIVPIVSNTEGITFANSIWYTNHSRNIFESQGGLDYVGSSYLNEVELGESGFFMFVKTIMELIFEGLDDLTVDISNMNTQYHETAFAVPVPIVHESFQGDFGYYAEVASPHIDRDDVLYSQIVEWQDIVEDPDVIFSGGTTYTIQTAGFVVIQASFDVIRDGLFPYYTRIEIWLNGVQYDTRRYEYDGVGQLTECTIQTSIQAKTGDLITCVIANQQGAYIADNSQGTFTVEAQGAGRGRFIDVANLLPIISQRDFVKEIFKLFNIVPIEKNKVVTLHYFESIKQNTPIIFDLDKKLQTNVATTLIRYGQNNILKYQTDENVERLDSNSSFPVNSQTLVKEVVKIDSFFSATDDSIVPLKDLSIPNYSMEWHHITDNKMTVANGSPNYSTADRNFIKAGDFIEVIGTANVRKRVIAVIDDFSGVCDANFTGNAPGFDWQVWRYNANDVLSHIATIKQTANTMQVWDGSFVQNYSNANDASFVGLRWIELQAQYYQLIEDLAFKPFVVTAWVSLEIVKFVSINGLEPIYVEEFDAYFYANRIEQWKYNGDTRVELIQIPY